MGQGKGRGIVAIFIRVPAGGNLWDEKASLSNEWRLREITVPSILEAMNSIDGTLDSCSSITCLAFDTRMT